MKNLLNLLHHFTNAGELRKSFQKMLIQIKYFSFIFCLTFISIAAAQSGLQYQNRGNRHEGIKPKPVSGYDIELISAKINYQEETDQFPDFCRIRFFLKSVTEVHLIVRELDYRYFYWMDKVNPQKPWRPGFENVFAWPTKEVIQQLKGLKPYDLGVVARLNKEEASKTEDIAPVILYHNKVPSMINGYLFTFKTNGDARFTCSIYGEGEEEPTFTSIFQRQRGGRPFTVRWDSKNAMKGLYKLVIKGYFLENNIHLDQTVRFFHEPIVKP